MCVYFSGGVVHGAVQRRPQAADNTVFLLAHVHQVRELLLLLLLQILETTRVRMLEDT